MIHDDLLEIADELARRDPRRPKQTSLRRAVSSAYYAVFHAVAYTCTIAFVTWNKPWNVVTPVYRSLDHGPARKVFDSDRQGIKFGPEAASLGRIFIQLQQARYTADYDPGPFPLNRQDTLELIDRAREAVQLIGKIPDEKRLLLAIQLIVKQR
jgi:hypothetical protein